MCGFSFTQTGNEDTMVKIKGNRQSVRFPVWDYGTHLGGWDSGRIRTDAASAHHGNEKSFLNAGMLDLQGVAGFLAF